MENFLLFDTPKFLADDADDTEWRSRHQSKQSFSLTEPREFREFCVVWACFFFGGESEKSRENP